MLPTTKFYNYLLGTWEPGTQRRPKRPPKDSPLTGRPTCQEARREGLKGHPMMARTPNKYCRATQQGGATDQPACRAIQRGSVVDKPGCRVTQQGQLALRRTPLLKGRADLVLSSHVDAMGHHRAMPRPWKPFQRVPIKHDARYVSSLSSGTGQHQL
jgi:hypothetical protein